jgi:hypothetical protein
VTEVAHDFSSGGHVWHATLGEMPKFSGDAVHPFISVGIPDELGMVERFTGGWINGSVGGVESHCGACDLDGEAGDVMYDDDVLRVFLMMSMMVMLILHAMVIVTGDRA